jgi:benzodiazapine receptor
LRGVRRQILGFLAWLLAVVVAAGIGALSSSDAGSFYAQLARPSWAPPGWLFGPVWSVLYFLMALSAWLVWRLHGFNQAREALAVFGMQLALNALWTPMFFLWKQGGLAFVNIVLLELFIIATIAMFWRLNTRLAAALLLPYLAWVTFAAFLNLSVWQLNPNIL